jgi:lipoprotein-releasing system ATP-binding protein
MVLIKTIDLVKEYVIAKNEKLRVLDGINIEVHENEIISIIGASGAGKSTLLHLIGTLDKPTSGSILIEDNDISKLGSDQLAKFRNSKIGFIFQFHHLLPEFSAHENVAIAGLISGGSRKEIFDKAEKLLFDVGLSERLKHQPSELSGGEQQRVAIARALINSPKVILADEPTGNLDSHNSNEIIDLIFKLRENYKQTYIIVTHNESFASMTDRTIKMADGKIIE